MDTPGPKRGWSVWNRSLVAGSIAIGSPAILIVVFGLSEAALWAFMAPLVLVCLGAMVLAVASVAGWADLLFRAEQRTVENFSALLLSTFASGAVVAALFRL